MYWAVPLETSIVDKTVIPSLNVILPDAKVGTVAVKVTEFPQIEVVVDCVTTTVEVAVVVVYVWAAEVDGPKLVSVGVKTAVMECGEPTTDKLDTFNVAIPVAVTTFEFPITVKPSLKTTFPAWPVGVIVAVKVTDVPNNCGDAGDTARLVVVVAEVMVQAFGKEVTAL